jgi:hypothetical protein
LEKKKTWVQDILKRQEYFRIENLTVAMESGSPHRSKQ